MAAVTALIEPDHIATSAIGLDQAMTAAVTAHLDGDATRLADLATAVTASLKSKPT